MSSYGVGLWDSRVIMACLHSAHWSVKSIYMLLAAFAVSVVLLAFTFANFACSFSELAIKSCSPSTGRYVDNLRGFFIKFVITVMILWHTFGWSAALETPCSCNECTRGVIKQQSSSWSHLILLGMSRHLQGMLSIFSISLKWLIFWISHWKSS